MLTSLRAIRIGETDHLTASGSRHVRDDGRGGDLPEPIGQAAGSDRRGRILRDLAGKARGARGGDDLRFCEVAPEDVARFVGVDLTLDRRERP